MIQISIANTGSVRTSTMLSLIGMIYNTKIPFHIYQAEGCYVHENRWKAVREAQESNKILNDVDKITHIFFLDSDILCEPDTINKLLELNKDVAGCLYNYRRFPPTLTAKFMDDNGNLIAKSFDEIPKEPFKLFGLGTGAMLIKVDVFEKITQPWFHFTYNLDGSLEYSEDTYFCDKLMRAGIEVWCDPRIKVGHEGTYVY